MSETDAAIFDHDHWARRLAELAPVYRAAAPFPHLVLDDFLTASAADRMLAEFPRVADGEWIQYQHVNERKLGRRDRASFGPALGAAIDALSSPRFVSFLERLTGIEGLLADPSLEGGGLHQSERGGFVNLHADFTVHPHHRGWRRRINVLVYLNEGWADAWGGHLELWDRSVTRCVRRVSPLHNRAVIFNTDEGSFHGHPDPLTCPEGETRKSVALYYFTAEATPAAVRSTEYRPRPGEGARGLLVHADTLALRLYDRLKRRFGFDDRLVSRVLGALRKKER
jgi:hypothetical protein